MPSIRNVLRFSTAACFHGIGTGIIGMCISLLIRHVQEVSYGASKGDFLEIDLSTPPGRRFICVFSGGIFGAFAWYWLRGLQPAIVSVESSLKDGKQMPPIVTIVNGMIQDIVVALGGSFGREAAPREIAAMWGGSLADLMRCSSEDRAILVACGTGAGLAAVYSVPISGTLYTLEHVMTWKLSMKSVIAAVVTSIIATYVASPVVDSKGLYKVPNYSHVWPPPELIIWALVIGPIAGIAGMCFRRLVKFIEQYRPRNRLVIKFHDVAEGQTILIDACWGEVAKKSATEIIVAFNDRENVKSYTPDSWCNAQPQFKRDWGILVVLPTVFLALALVAEEFPALLGNGRALAEVAISRERSLIALAALLILKVLLTAASIGAGAAGGTLTPSVAIGATVGAILGQVCQFHFPDLAPASSWNAHMSIISAASFLAVAMKSPVTGLWLLMEFAGQGVDRNVLLATLWGDFSGIIESKLALGMLVPMVIAVIGATNAAKITEKAWECMSLSPWPMVKSKPLLAQTHIVANEVTVGQHSDYLPTMLDIVKRSQIVAKGLVRDALPEALAEDLLEKGKRKPSKPLPTRPW